MSYLHFPPKLSGKCLCLWVASSPWMEKALEDSMEEGDLGSMSQRDISIVSTCLECLPILVQASSACVEEFLKFSSPGSLHKITPFNSFSSSRIDPCISLCTHPCTHSHIHSYTHLCTHSCTYPWTHACTHSYIHSCFLLPEVSALR